MAVAVTASGQQNDLFKAVIHNAGVDPLQGYDVDVWVVDQGTGSFNLVGRFNAIQIMVRNSSESYMEFNQRIARELDGDVRIEWRMERGQLDARVIEQTFGFSEISRANRVNRFPRFEITFQMQAKELHGSTIGTSTKYGTQNTNSFMRLSFCKLDAFTLAAQAGASIVANRWEGVAESLKVVDTSEDSTLDGWGTSLLAENALQTDLGWSLTAAEVDPYNYDSNMFSIYTPPTDPTQNNNSNSEEAEEEEGGEANQTAAEATT